MSNLNIPNILTVIRILLVPVFLYFILADDLWAATVVFIIAGLTDGVDGFIARNFGRRTELGANLDPVADKFLLVSSFLALTYKGIIPLWLCVPVILRDAVILSGVVVLRASGRKVVISPTIYGKVTTILQLLVVILAVAFPRVSGTFFTALAVATALLTVYTGFHYAVREYGIQFKGRER